MSDEEKQEACKKPIPSEQKVVKWNAQKLNGMHLLYVTGGSSSAQELEWSSNVFDMRCEQAKFFWSHTGKVAAGDKSVNLRPRHGAKKRKEKMQKALSGLNSTRINTDEYKALEGAADTLFQC